MTTAPSPAHALREGERGLALMSLLALLIVLLGVVAAATHAFVDAHRGVAAVKHRARARSAADSALAQLRADLLAGEHPAELAGTVGPGVGYRVGCAAHDEQREGEHRVVARGRVEREEQHLARRGFPRCEQPQPQRLERLRAAAAWTHGRTCACERRVGSEWSHAVCRRGESGERRA